MVKIRLYDETKTYQWPNGEMATPEDVRRRHPATEHFPFLIETDENEQVILAIQNLSHMRGFYNIKPILPNEKALSLIEEIVNSPDPEPEISTADRTAAALEALVMMNLPDIDGLYSGGTLS